MGEQFDARAFAASLKVAFPDAAQVDKITEVVRRPYKKSFSYSDDYAYAVNMWPQWMIQPDPKPEVNEDNVLQLISIIALSRNEGNVEEAVKWLERAHFVPREIPDRDEATYLTRIVPDETEDIQQAVKFFCDVEKVQLLVSTGGTGFAPRDVTPEAVGPLLDKHASGAVHMIISVGLQHTKLAWLSRPIVGVRHRTLVICLPGAPKGSVEGLAALVDNGLWHAVQLSSGERCSHPERHQEDHSTLKGSQAQHHSTPHHSGAAKEDSREDVRHVRSVAGRARKSIYPMLSMDEAAKVVRLHTPARPRGAAGVPTQRYAELLGCVLAQDVVCPFPHPPFRASIKDGYAVVSQDGPGVYPCTGAFTAGSAEFEKFTLQAGEVCRVSTGGPVPAGADAVVQVEDTELVEHDEDKNVERKIRILCKVAPGSDIRPVGCDIAQGQVVLVAGSILGPAEIGMLHAVGARTVRVHRKPAVCVLSTGDELTAAQPNELSNSGSGEAAKTNPAAIFDSNKGMLMAALTKAGFNAVDGGICRDEMEDTRKKFKAALSMADVVVSSGGVSMGEVDCVKEVVEELGGTIRFGRIRMKPGKPTMFATTNDGKLCFGLPGNPVSAFVTLHLFVIPALRRMACMEVCDHSILDATLDEELPIFLDADRPEYRCCRVRYSTSRQEFLVRFPPNLASHQLLACRDVNGLMVLPIADAKQERFERGQRVKVILIGEFST